MSDQMVFLSETIPTNVAHERPHFLVHDLVVLLEIVPPREPRLAYIARKWFLVRLANVCLAFLYSAKALRALCASVRCADTVVAVVRTVAGVLVTLTVGACHVVVRVLARCTRLGTCRTNGWHIAILLHFGILVRLHASVVVIVIIVLLHAETMVSHSGRPSRMPWVNGGVHVISRIGVRVSSYVVEG